LIIRPLQDLAVLALQRLTVDEFGEVRFVDSIQCFIELPASSGCILKRHIDQVGELF